MQREVTERKYCRTCGDTVLATRVDTGDDDLLVTIGTLGIPWLLGKLGLAQSGEPWRCPHCGQAIEGDGRRTRGEWDASRRSRDTARGRDEMVRHGGRVPSAEEYRRAYEQVADGTREGYERYEREVKPGLALYYSEPFTAQIDKLTLANNVDRALKLFKAVKPYRLPLLRRAGLFLGIQALTLAAAAGALVFGLWQVNTASATDSWPTTSGTVLSSRVSVSKSDNGTSYSPDISYSYEVNGFTYTADKVTFLSTGGRDGAESIVARYPVNAAIDVYYNPLRPSKAVLIPGMDWSTYMFAIIGVGGIVASLIMAAIRLPRFLAFLKSYNSLRVEGNA